MSKRPPHSAQGTETRSVRSRRVFLRAHWGARRPLWAPLSRFSSALVAPVAFEPSSRASFGRERTRGLCSQCLPAQTQMWQFIKKNQYDFRRAPICNKWYPSVPLGSRKPPQGPPRDPQEAPQKDPQGYPKEFLGPPLAATFFG